MHVYFVGMCMCQCDSELFLQLQICFPDNCYILLVVIINIIINSSV